MIARLLDAFEERLGEMAESINELVHMFEAAGWTVVPRSSVNLKASGLSAVLWLPALLIA